ncbi:MAG: hypothetical protein AWU57_38 [Marinobacter sp. T13-3]|nr:MAG: hypothetical protein AWU57_38 [Marinobacter sp. T13-3]
MSDWYHGSQAPVTGYRDDHGRSDGPDKMFFSASANVARRYGESVVCLSSERLAPVVSVSDWLAGDDARLPSTGSFIIRGESDSYDFPVDTLVLRETPDAPLVALSPEELAQLDDGLPMTHDPDGPGDRGWAVYVDDFYGGDEDQALADIQRAGQSVAPA